MLTSHCSSIFSQLKRWLLSLFVMLSNFMEFPVPLLVIVTKYFLVDFGQRYSGCRSKMKSSADAHCCAVQFEVGDFVYLKLRPYHLRSLAKRPNEKLSLQYFGPYKVVQQIGSMAYKLEFPSSTTIHLVFHVSQLKQALGSADLCQPLSLILADDLEWLVEFDQVLHIRQSPNNNPPVIEVLIQWKELPRFEASWESADTIKERFPNFHLKDKVSHIEGDWNSLNRKKMELVRAGCSVNLVGE
ncbi:hypothetical protein CK203_106818 [Vitis vinifera]|uniref:Tf2-1-like SH3-like domain-containing protein n=1 Tax=Vitis vinifera TaxID=29760 RepID=A0A438DLG9_VITVI|nr:hypothetical protein CK203_106818 [Vitis vinifera]